MLTAGFTDSAVGAPSETSETLTTSTTTSVVTLLETTTTVSATTTTLKPYKPYDAEWLRTLKAPPDSYWDMVAKCETGNNWQNKGKWAGGLGIYIRTWKNFGGLQFAKHPSLATREEQIVIANNIALYGWQTTSFLTYEDRVNNKPFFRNPVGFNGWGCIKNNPHLKPPVPTASEASRNR